MMTRSNTIAQLDLIWDALHQYRENIIPEGTADHDNIWSDICTAMNWITEDLGFDALEIELGKEQ